MRPTRRWSTCPTCVDLSVGELAAVLRAAGPHLVSLHAFEVLAGMLAPSNAAGVPTGAVAALHALADARSRGLDDGEILATLPVVLALVPPRVGPLVPLPPVPKALPPVPDGNVPLLVARESLRLRARWLQELTARAAWEIGRRLAETGDLASPERCPPPHPRPARRGAPRRAARHHPPGRCAGGGARAAPGPVPARRRWRGRAGRQPWSQGGRSRGRWRTGQRSCPSRRRRAGRLGPGRPHAVARPGAAAAPATGPGGRDRECAVAPRDPRPGVGRPGRRRGVGCHRPVPEGTIVSVDGGTGDVSVLQSLEGATS